MNSEEGHDLSGEQLAEVEGVAELDQVILVIAPCHRVVLVLDLERIYFPHK